MHSAIPESIRGLSGLYSFFRGIKNLVLWSDALQGHLRHVRKSSLKELPVGCGTDLAKGFSYTARLLSTSDRMVVLSDMVTASNDFETLKQIEEKRNVILLLINNAQAGRAFAGSRVKVISLLTE